MKDQKSYTKLKVPQVLGDKVILELDNGKKEGDLIYRAETAVDKLQTRLAVVTGCGPGYWNNEEQCYAGMSVKVGDTVLILNSVHVQLDAFNGNQVMVELHNIIQVVGYKDV